MNKISNEGNSKTIGPYRLINELGKGGMGEVWLAFDERLERYVAIKRIQNEKLSDGYQKRFRREAKLIARLNHPAIVQIYDVIGTDTIDALVMEYVDGFTLKDLLENKKFTVQEALELTITLAQGLAAAHGKDIIHRDLKCSNILISKQGEVKITDFGIAKNYLKSGDDISITLDDELCFSYSSLSPEQALGEELDIRTDIFSLGVIIFQLLTGVHPFDHGDGRVAQLYRLVNEPHPVLGMLVEEMPEVLEELVDDMLAKQPILRPSNIQAVLVRLIKIQQSMENCESDDSTCESPLGKNRLVINTAVDSINKTVSKRKLIAVALFFVVIIISGFLFFELLTEPKKKYVAVLKPVINSYDSATNPELIQTAVHQALIDGVMSLKGLVLIDPAHVAEMGGTIGQKAKALAADDIMSSQLNCQGLRCQVIITRSSGSKMEVSGKKEVIVDVDGLLAMNRYLMSIMQNIYSDYNLLEGYFKMEVKEDDYLEYLRILHRYDKGDTESLIENLKEIIHSSEGFPHAYYLLSEIFHIKYQETRKQEWLIKWKALLKSGGSIIGDNLLFDLKWFEYFLLSASFEKANEVIKKFKSSGLLGDKVYLMEAKLLFEKGNVLDAINILNSIKDRYSNWSVLYYLALYESNYGMFDEAQVELNRVLEFYPGNRLAIGLMGDINLYKGNFNKSIIYYEKILEGDMDYATMINLGLAYILTFSYDKAYDSLSASLQKHPKDPIANLSYADILFIKNRVNEAKIYYQKTIDIVMQNEKPNWQSYSLMAQSYARLGNNDAAVEYIQKSLIKSPDSSQLAFEAALVYCILGDVHSALYHVKRALNMGYSQKWFVHPWFDNLKAETAFKRLVSSAST